MTCCHGGVRDPPSHQHQGLHRAVVSEVHVKIRIQASETNGGTLTISVPLEPSEVLYMVTGNPEGVTVTAGFAGDKALLSYSELSEVDP